MASQFVVEDIISVQDPITSFLISCYWLSLNSTTEAIQTANSESYKRTEYERREWHLDIFREKTKGFTVKFKAGKLES